MESFIGNIKKFFKSNEDPRETIEDILDDMDMNDNEQISEHQKLMLSNILYLSDKKCNQVMTPRANIDIFPKTGKIVDLAKNMIEKGRSRVPIFDESLDDIVGIIHIIDVAKFLIDGDKETTAGQIIHNGVKFVSPSIRVPDLLLEMQNEKVHMAIVIDEYGGVDGIITIEDLLEEIVGDIEDEYDFDESHIKLHSNKRMITADANATIEDILSETGIDLSENISDFEEFEIETLAGLILHYTQSIPEKGQLIHGNNGIVFRIIDADPRKIKKAMVILPQDENNDEND